MRIGDLCEGVNWQACRIWKIMRHNDEMVDQYTVYLTGVMDIALTLYNTTLPEAKCGNVGASDYLNRAEWLLLPAQ